VRIQVPKSLDEVKSGFDPLPEGTYRVRATEAKVKTSGKGNPYVAFTFQVVDNETASFNNRKLFHNSTITEETLGFLKQVLEALGTPWDAEGFDTDDVIGNECIVGVKIQPRSDQPEVLQNTIKTFAKAA
jgi:hypothetical protein